MTPTNTFAASVAPVLTLVGTGCQPARPVLDPSTAMPPGDRPADGAASSPPSRGTGASAPGALNAAR